MSGLVHFFTRCGVGAQANPQVRPQLSSCLAPFKAEAVSTHCQLALPEMHSLSGAPRESSERKEGEPCHRPGTSPEWDNKRGPQNQPDLALQGKPRLEAARRA